MNKYIKVKSRTDNYIYVKVATEDVQGIVKPDNDTLAISSDGTLRVTRSPNADMAKYWRESDGTPSSVTIDAKFESTDNSLNKLISDTAQIKKDLAKKVNVLDDGRVKIEGAPVDADDAVRKQELDTKLDKSGGTISGSLIVTENLTVQGKTTSVDTDNLKVADKLIYVAKDNTVPLTSPAGLITPKYDGTNNGGIVYDSTGTAYVGDIALTGEGNVDVANSDLQPIATRSEKILDGNFIKWDDTNKKLVDSGISVQGLNEAISTAQVDIDNINNAISSLEQVDIALSTDITGLRETSTALNNDINDIYNILGQTVVTDTEVEDTYSSRITAGGLDIIDGIKTKVSKIKGSSVYSDNTLINAKFKGIKSHGRNLFEMSESLSTDKLTITKNSDGSFTFNAVTPVGSQTLRTNFYEIFIPKGATVAYGGTYTGFSISLIYRANTVEAGLQNLMYGDLPFDYDCYGIALEIQDTTGNGITNATIKDFYVELSSESLTPAYTEPKTTDSSFMLDSAVELKCGDYIDVQKQQIVRKTFTYAITGSEQALYWWTGPTAAFFQATINSPALIKLMGDYKADGSGLTNAVCTGYTYVKDNTGIAAAPNMSFKMVGSSRAFFFKNTNYTSLEAWKAHLVELYEAGTPLTITYETAEVQSTEAISIPTQYTVYKNGAEIIVSVDSAAEETQPTQCTVTQNYYVKSGV